MVTLNTHRPSEHRYRILGTGGSAKMFSYEGVSRIFDRTDNPRDGWKIVPVSRTDADDDPTGGHGGTDIKLARHFAGTLIEDNPFPIDAYRAIEYTLPGILAARSADLGGAIAIPDMRREPFVGTGFWETIGLPETDPEPALYRAPI